MIIFHSDTNFNETTHFRVDKSEDDVWIVYMKNSTFGNNDTTFNFIISIYNTTELIHQIAIKGEMSTKCEKSWCTVLIAFLASLCLIFFAGLSVSLIILRRKKPFKMPFRNPNKDTNGNVSFNLPINE